MAVASSCTRMAVSRAMQTKAQVAAVGLSVSKPMIPAAAGLGRALPMRVQRTRRSVAARAGPVSVTAAMDPQGLNDLANHVYTLAAEEGNGGFLGPVVGALEYVLKVIDGQLENLDVAYSYGFAIIILTVLVKVVTYPLSKKQVESTMAMQALQPRIKDLQARYANDKERLQMETARLYQDAGVNPLAGCLPTLATLPVWIGLYRALTNVANEGLLTDGFFWIPSLAGPTSMAERDGGSGLSWLALVDGAPAMGWHDAAAYLVMPVLLTVSQYVSQAIISPPKSDDPSQQQANAILKFLPLMIGWFSLNVPSGLTLYWFTNNVLTTAQQVYLRKSGATVEVPVATAPGGGTVMDTTAQPMGGPGAPTASVAQTGETRAQRRERERAETRGKRFAERKANEKKKKAGKTAAELPTEAPPADAAPVEEPSNTSS